MGGFLDKLTKTSWEGFDGKRSRRDSHFFGLVSRGLLPTWCNTIRTVREKEDFPESIAVASAELVAARFISQVRLHCKEPDCDNLQRGFFAWDSVSPKQTKRTTKRLQEVMDLIERVEASDDKALLGPESDTDSLKAGPFGAQSSVRRNDARKRWRSPILGMRRLDRFSWVLPRGARRSRTAGVLSALRGALWNKRGGPRFPPLPNIASFGYPEAYCDRVFQAVAEVEQKLTKRHNPCQFLLDGQRGDGL